MEIIKTDVAIVGAGGTGLRAAIAVAENAGVTYPLFKVPYNFYDYIIISGGSFSLKNFL